MIFRKSGKSKKVYTEEQLIEMNVAAQESDVTETSMRIKMRQNHGEKDFFNQDNKFIKFEKSIFYKCVISAITTALVAFIGSYWKLSTHVAVNDEKIRSIAISIENNTQRIKSNEKRIDWLEYKVKK